MIKHSDKNNLREKAYLTLQIQRDGVHPGREDVGKTREGIAVEPGSWLITLPLHSENKQEVGPGYKASKPALCDTLPPTRLYLLKVP